jgi:hypothetical protein
MRIGVILAAGIAAVAIGFGYVYSDALAPLWRTYVLGEPASRSKLSPLRSNASI